MPDGSGMRIGVVVSQWNNGITEKLFDGALQTLLSSGCKPGNIIRKTVPGSFELPAGAMFIAESQQVDAVICLGCIIRGETPHFEYIAQAVSQGLMDLTLKLGIPIIFGVLTTENPEQAMDRAGGKHGNKGIEAAATALQMIALKKDLPRGKQD